ncbi:probable 6-phosphogluconolactonase [Artemia franciscana]|uniref:Glucosamine/galactosamine-6-phosphate isomerase domain-containing protein n=1 Tax=Artemia franciscana TaxID=6661 RepID=A0AA88L4K2_ARTSF|nr:hypothetical protein QYM36_005817 [Artemia franciscana]
MFLSACVKMCENFQDVRKIEVVKDSQRVSERLIEILVSAAESVIAEKNAFTVGLSGGSMVDFLCSGFLRREAKVDLTKWKFFFCDERIVPVHHSESTFGTYKRKLLTILPIDEKQFIPVDTSMTRNIE